MTVRFTLPMPASPTPLAPGDDAVGATATELPGAVTELSRCAARFPKHAHFSIKMPAVPVEVNYTVTLLMPAADWPKEWNGVIPK